MPGSKASTYGQSYGRSRDVSPARRKAAKQNSQSSRSPSPARSNVQTSNSHMEARSHHHTMPHVVNAHDLNRAQADALPRHNSPSSSPSHSSHSHSQSPHHHDNNNQPQHQQRLDNDRETLHERSLAQRATWTNTVQSDRKQRLAATTQRLAHEEQNRLDLDAAWARQLADERQLALEVAQNKQLWNNDPRYRSLHERLALGDVLEERDLHQKYAHQKQSYNKIREDHWALQQESQLAEASAIEQAKQEQKHLERLAIAADQLEQVRIRHTKELQDLKREKQESSQAVTAMLNTAEAAQREIRDKRQSQQRDYIQSLNESVQQHTRIHDQERQVESQTELEARLFQEARDARTKYHHQIVQDKVKERENQSDRVAQETAMAALEQKAKADALQQQLQMKISPFLTMETSSDERAAMRHEKDRACLADNDALINRKNQVARQHQQADEQFDASARAKLESADRRSARKREGRTEAMYKLADERREQSRTRHEREQYLAETDQKLLQSLNHHEKDGDRFYEEYAWKLIKERAAAGKNVLPAIAYMHEQNDETMGKIRGIGPAHSNTFGRIFG